MLRRRSARTQRMPRHSSWQSPLSLLKQILSFAKICVRSTILPQSLPAAAAAEVAAEVTTPQAAEVHTAAEDIQDKLCLGRRRTCIRTIAQSVIKIPSISKHLPSGSETVTVWFSVSLPEYTCSAYTLLPQPPEKSAFIARTLLPSISISALP